jgi:germination protein M
MSISVLLVLLLTACGEEPEPTGTVYRVYHLRNNDTGIMVRDYVSENTDAEQLIEELIRAMSVPSERFDYRNAISGDFQVLAYSLFQGQVTIELSEHYRDLTSISEVLTRAAIVRTLTQVEEVNVVTMTIRGEPLIDGSGMFVGAMTADMFIDIVGGELDAYTMVSLRLYFGLEDGLFMIDRHDVIHSSNVAIERLIVESLIGGPLDGENVIATLNPDIRLISITTTGGMCYVNFDEQFTQLLPDVSVEMAIYSIVNSLVELSHISQVRISLGGAATVIFDSINLAMPFERNLDLVKQNK